MTWTPERIEILKKLAAEKQSARQIAEKLGGGISRSAVIAKLHRLGLTTSYSRLKQPRPKHTNMGGFAFKPLPEKVKQKRQEIERAEKANTRAEAARIASNIAAGHYPNKCTLLELTSDTCRWPVGDPQQPDFFFCGEKPIEGLPYCMTHCGIAYSPPSERRRDRRPPAPEQRKWDAA